MKGKVAHSHMSCSDESTLRKRIQELQELRRMGITTFAEAEKYERDKVARVRPHPSNPRHAPLTNPPTDQLNFRAAPIRHNESGEPSYPPGRNSESLPYYSWGSRQRAFLSSDQLTFATSSSLNLLTPQEQTLCAQLRILPKPYLAIKSALLREYAKKGGKLRKRDAKDMFKIDIGKTAKIWEFLEKSGLFKPYAIANAAAVAAAAARAGSAAPTSSIGGGPMMGVVIANGSTG